MDELKTLDLFSGIGGFSLGLERAGPFRTAAFCEQDEFCQAVLRKHWPGVPVHDDIRTIDADGYRGIDLICGGFPCQPWSAAGQQRGAADDRDLWPEMLRIIEAVQSRWVIGENVRGFVNERLGLQRSLSDLENIGYSVVPFVIPACAVNAPHRRDRVWIVAHADDTRPQGPIGEWKAEAKRTPNGHPSECSEDVAHTSGARGAFGLPGQDDGQKRHAEKPDDRGHRRHGWSASDNWAFEPDVGRVAHGVPNRAHRLKALGNAVVPQVVTQIGKAILAAEQQ